MFSKAAVSISTGSRMTNTLRAVQGITTAAPPRASSAAGAKAGPHDRSGRASRRAASRPRSAIQPAARMMNPVVTERVSAPRPSTTPAVR
jgi:hypothetical protein